MHRGRLAAAVVLVAVVVAGAAGVAGTATGTDGAAVQDDAVAIELSVSTTDGEPIDDVRATVEWDDGSVETETRSNGKVFEDVPAGADLQITLEHEDYVMNGVERVSDVEADQLVEMTMHEPATATIEVVQNDSSAVEDATVRFQKEGQGVVADRGTTDADGIYESAEVEAGSYSVRVTKDGFYEEEFSLDLPANGTETVEVEQGQITADVRVQDGVLDDNPGVSADVDLSRDGQRVVSVTTNDAGRRSVTLDVNTRYDVSVTKDGYQTMETRIRTGETDHDLVFNVSRSTNLTATPANSQVVVGERLQVEVTDEYDRPVEGATVSVDGETLGETNAEGEARVEITEAGEQDVTASYGDLESAPVTVTGVSAGGDDGNETDGDSDSDDGSPGFGLAAALAALLAVAAYVDRR